MNGIGIWNPQGHCYHYMVNELYITPRHIYYKGYICLPLHDCVLECRWFLLHIVELIIARVHFCVLMLFLKEFVGNVCH